MGNLSTSELARLLDEPTNFGIQLQWSVHLAEAVKNREAHKIRNIMSAFGKTRRGYNDLDPILKQDAMNILQANGYYPTTGYRTMEFHIVRKQ